MYIILTQFQGITCVTLISGMMDHHDIFIVNMFKNKKCNINRRGHHENKGFQGRGGDGSEYVKMRQWSDMGTKNCRRGDMR